MEKSLHSVKLIIVLAAVFVFSGLYSYAQITVNSLPELLPYLDDDNVSVKLAPGTYSITASDITNGTFSDFTTINGNKTYVLLLVEGSNSTYDFTGVKINIETAVFNAIPSDAGDFFQIQVVGNNNVLKNLTMEDVGSVHDYPKYGCLNVVMDGRENRIEGFHITTRGSFPYGYGDCFGKGGTYTIKHYKHSAFLVRGLRNHALNDTIFHYSYGHAMFMQAASYPKIEGCYIVGEVRSTDDMLAEEGTGSAADLIDFYTVWGYRLPPGFMKSLGEGGIRAYNAGNTVIDGVEYSRGTDNPTIINNYIKNLRTGVTLTHATGTKYVSGCTTIGTERGYAIGSGTIVDCYSDVQYGPAFGVDYESDKNITAEITILPHEGETFNGDKYCAYITGSGHNITLKSQVTNPDQELKIEFGGDRRIISDLATTENYLAKNITLYNYTNFPIVLNDLTNDNSGVSGGMVTDFGTNNNFSHIAVSAGKYEAENYSNASGVSTETTTDEGAGENVTSIDSGDWMEYDIDVPFTGTYQITYRVASESANGSFNVTVDGETLETVTFSSTGGAQTWTSVSSASPVVLTKGTQKVKLNSNSSGWNINWLDLTLECAALEIKPKYEIVNPMGNLVGSSESTSINLFKGNTLLIKPEPSVGGVWNWTGPNGFASGQREIELGDIQLEDSGDYVVSVTNDCGQQSTQIITVSVQDSFVFEAESYQQMSGVETQLAESSSGGSIVSAIEAGDWVEYELEVPFSAIYTIDYGIASETAGSFSAVIDGDDTREISFVASGAAGTWITVSTDSIVYLAEGTHTLRILANSSGWNIDWIKLRGKRFVSPCSLPALHAGFTVVSDQLNWSSGLIDITCAESVNIYTSIEGVGNLDSFNYLKMYYKIDDGDPVALANKTGGFEWQSIIRKGLSGSTLELLIEANSIHAYDYYYQVSQINIVESTDQTARIEAEDFDDMSGVSTSATRLGSIQPGEWSMYAGLDLTGLESIDASVGTVYDDAYIEVRLDSVDGLLAGKIIVPNTGSYNSYQTANGSISEVIGIHDVYLVYQTSGSPNVCNIDWFQFHEAVPVVTIDPFSKIEAEEYNNMLGIQTENTADEGGGLNVGWIETGDWLMFSGIDFTGIKSVDTRLATSNSTSTIEIRIDSPTGDLIGTVTVPNTGGFQAWETANTQLSDVSGTHDVYLVFKGATGYLCNINWLQFKGISTASQNEINRSSIRIYPNPVLDKLKIDGGKDTIVRIYNHGGAIVKNAVVSENIHTLDVTELNAGFYILNLIRDNNEVVNFKVIKK